jgi:hypothetical protein
MEQYIENKLGYEVYWSDIRPYQNDDLDRVLLVISISKNYHNLNVVKPREKILKYNKVEENNNEYIKYIRNRDMQEYVNNCNLDAYEGLEGDPSIMRIYYPNDNAIRIELRNFNRNN